MKLGAWFALCIIFVVRLVDLDHVSDVGTV
jgi:hypothetical protein